VLARVGRIEVSGHPDFDWIGTGFLVARDIVMTNRHVAVEFARQSGAKWQFQAGRASSIDLREEFGSTETFEVSVKEVVGVHKTLDLALLKVEAASRDGRPLPDPLPLASSEPAGLAGRKVYAVGYPAWDGRRNDPEPMRRVFMDIYNVKRLQPGEVLGRDGDALQVLHDCSTLGGNSGSPIVDLDTHQVIGLHFGGRFLQNNFAVPLWLLTGDALIKRARLNFA
jgi:V8-like Glu-specific endopeptidase